MFYPKELLENQLQFQKLFGLDLNNLTPAKQRELGEKYLQKAIEEVVETRKTFPSGLGFIDKNTPVISRTKMLREFVDIQLFLANFYLTFKFSADELEETVKYVQANNFAKIRPKALKLFNEDIVSVGNLAGYKKVSIGRGNCTPKFIFVGQCPPQCIENGDTAFSNLQDRQMRGNLLLRVLEELGYLSECYFTNAVKSTVNGDNSPQREEFDFWKPILKQELSILTVNNPAIIIPLGHPAKKMTGLPGISNPAITIYGMDEDEYRKILVDFIEARLEERANDIKI